MRPMEKEPTPTHFIRHIIEEDIASGKHNGTIVTRFPPEPNGYLHIGHAKSICLNFGLAKDFNSPCHLRFDDSNPEKESIEYANSIMEDVKWLGFDWKDKIFYASDYFEKLYDFAVLLIKKGKAFVCELTPEELKNHRGNLTEPGKHSPFRNRSVEENLELFKKMREGKIEDGKLMLRAKIDMSSPNINMRDPVLYRTKRHTHFRTGDKWPIYPMYDFAHPLSDAIEGITHSLCTLEFEDHRPLYDWFIENCETEYKPRQIEFSRLNLEFTVMSKRRLLELVTKKLVNGWDDPRMPTISGMRRRGITPGAIRKFCEQIGITKKDSSITMTTLESCIRDDLGPITPRALGVIDKLKVTITNLSTDHNENISCPFHPQDESFGNRDVPFTREIYIEKDDFMENPPKKYFRLSPGNSVRLRYAYIITCDDVIKNEQGEVIELKCSYHKDSFGGATPEGMKKVKGIIHWVSATKGMKATIRLIDRLFLVPNPGADKERSFTEDMNPDSLKTVEGIIEPAIADCPIGKTYQFERIGYFILDKDSTKEQKIFNRIITLKDTWAKIDGQD